MATEDDSDIPDFGAVFTFGKSRFGDSAPSKFWIRDDQVTQVACGDEHTALVSASGKLFTFGSNDWGQLGLGHNKITSKPSRVKALKNQKITQVTCGRTHTIVATESGKLFSFGNNGEGQLGIGNTNGQNQSKPVQIEGMQDHRITMLSAGNDHTVALTEDGEVFAWGGNDSGQCGLGDKEEVTTPLKLSLRERVTCISCGYYHTTFVTESGKLLTCGESEDDKLGLGTDEEYVKTPQEVQGIDGKVVHVASGGRHTIAITDSGTAYTFGDGSSGQLGLGTKVQKASTPLPLTTVTEKLKLASCGENHTAVISKMGSLYTFGDGRHGKLALGEENFANQFRPTYVSRFENFSVVQVSCGGCHMLVSAKKGLPNGSIMNGQHSAEEAEDEVDAAPMRPHAQKRMSQMDHLRESMDLEGSIGARNRRREKLPEPSSSFTGRVLPPLNSSFTSSGKQSLPSLTSTQAPIVTQSLDSGLQGKLRPVSRTLEMPVSGPPPPAEEREISKMAAMKEEDEGDSSEVSVTESEDEDVPKEGHNLKGGPQARPRPVPRPLLQKDNHPVAPSRPKAVSYGDQKPLPVRRQLAPLQAKGKKLEESEDESEEDSEEEKAAKKKGKSQKVDKKKEKDKKAKPPPKKKSSVGVFGKKKPESDEEDSEEDSEEDVKGKGKKGKETKKKTFYNDSEEEETADEDEESDEEEKPVKTKKELEKERKAKEKEERERKKQEEKERKQAEKERKEKEKKKEQQKKEAQKKKGSKAAPDKKKKGDEDEGDSDEDEDSLEEVTDEELDTDSFKTDKDDKEEATKAVSKDDKTPPPKPAAEKKSSACTIL